MHVFRLAAALPAPAVAAVIGAVLWVAPVRSASADYIATELYTLLPPSGYANSDLEVTAEMGPSISGQTVGIAQHVVNNQAMGILSELWDRTGTRLMLDPPTTGGFIDADVQTTDGVQQVGFGHVARGVPRTTSERCCGTVSVRRSTCIRRISTRRWLRALAVLSRWDGERAWA